MKRIFILFCIFLVTNLMALHEHQLTILKQVREVAKNLPNKKGETFEDTLSAICLTESSAGLKLIGDFKKHRNIRRASLGIMQIQVDTARFVSSQYKSLKWVLKLNDRDLINKLLLDTKFSANIAAHYIRWLSDRTKRYYNMVSKYTGIKSNRGYYNRVMRNIKIVRNLKHKGIID